MSWIDDIIESLPEKYEELARLYLPVMRRMVKEEALQWLVYLRNNKYVEAHNLLVKKMTNEEIAKDGEEGLDIVKKLNKENADRVEIGWSILEMLLLTWFDKID